LVSVASLAESAQVCPIIPRWCEGWGSCALSARLATDPRLVNRSRLIRSSVGNRDEERHRVFLQQETYVWLDYAMIRKRLE